MTPSPLSLGVVVGRFQVAMLHAGHRHLIATAAAAHKRLLIVVGSSRGLPSARHPLSFAARAAMLERLYPNAIVREQFDHPSDHAWSANLDRLVGAVAGNEPATLYGARDSFIPRYHGHYPTTVVVALDGHSGTSERAAMREHTGTSVAWRQGVIHAMQNRLPQTYSTVDVAVLRPGQILLAEKRQDEGRLRFIGGFLDATDVSDEAAARRELREEAGAFEAADWRCLGSARIDDWRYRGTPDGIMTRLFVTTHVFGRPEAGDDIDALHWVSRDTFRERLIKSHAPLGGLLAQFLSLHPHH